MVSKKLILISLTSMILVLQVGCNKQPTDARTATVESEATAVQAPVNLDDVINPAQQHNTDAILRDEFGFNDETIALLSDEFKYDPMAYREQAIEAKEAFDLANQQVEEWTQEKGTMITAESMRVQHEAAMVKHKYYMLLGGMWNEQVTDDIENKLLSLGLLEKGVYPKALLGQLEDGRDRFWFVAQNNGDVCLYRVDVKRGELLGDRCTRSSSRSGNKPGSLWDIQKNWEQLEHNLADQN